MEITPNSTFVVTDIESGTEYYAKGLYWHKKNLIIVGAEKVKDTDLKKKLNRYPMRWAVPSNKVRVEVI